MDFGGEKKLINSISSSTLAAAAAAASSTQLGINIINITLTAIATILTEEAFLHPTSIALIAPIINPNSREIVLISFHISWTWRSDDYINENMQIEVKSIEDDDD